MLGQDVIVDEEADEASSSNHVNNTLASFREQWQRELRISMAAKLPDNNKREAMRKACNPKEREEENEEEAKNWYLKGSELERAGIFYEAIQCYKKAVQLVPDIELRICQKPHRPENLNDYEASTTLQLLPDHEGEKSEDEKIKEGQLLAHIQKKMTKAISICQPTLDQSSKHISSLPIEILLYIFKWVVSSDLDLRSLEIASMCSRGFYLMARDPEIWKLACLRIWGINCGYPTTQHPTWREMYINRPRLHFHGCYISKTTYIRHGENSFQDQFYRPWHLVTYYRYLRFFPEGLVLMWTTPDEPYACVRHLKHRNGKIALRGHYRLKDDKVVLVVQDQQKVDRAVNARAKAKNTMQCEGGGEQSFHLEFQIVNSSHKRKHVQLVWKYYEVMIENRNGTVSKSGFDITSKRFPPLWFSRVRSYTQESDSPLI